jgi:hypothetical protein
LHSDTNKKKKEAPLNLPQGEKKEGKSPSQSPPRGEERKENITNK